MVYVQPIRAYNVDFFLSGIYFGNNMNCDTPYVAFINTYRLWISYFINKLLNPKLAYGWIVDSERYNIFDLSRYEIYVYNHSTINRILHGDVPTVEV